MSLWIVNRDGEILLHRNMPAGPDPFLKAIPPDREDRVVCVEGLFPWYWRADLCAREAMPFVLGQALSMKAIHGGKAKNDTIDAQKIAGRLRGGMLPQAYVDAAAMRATRDRRRRRRHLMRKRAARLAHGQHTHRQDNFPEIGKKMAAKANRDGVAERCPDPAVHKRLAVDLALIGHDDHRRRDVALSSRKAAKPDDATTLDVRRTGPGLGEILSLVRLDELHAIQRFPRGQDCVSSCRVVKGAKESAGTRDGTSGTKRGQADLPWAFSAAAGLCLRNHPNGQQDLPRLAKKPGQGNALTVLAPKLARGVSPRVKRHTAFEMPRFLQRASEAARVSPMSTWPLAGSASIAGAGVPMALRRERSRAQRPYTLSPAR